MPYKDTINFLLKAIDYEKISKYKYDESSFNLDRMNKLLDIVGNPHRNLQTIHVAGTKGKGSTSNMISSILIECGLKVGLFTSPHLIDLEERIRIDGDNISREELSTVTDELRPYIEEERKKDLFMSPTFFEVLTAIALLYFKKNGVDIAVMETGLGGRLDSTNVITPLASVITSIGFDHMDKLGNSLELIAGEKVGIIKSHIPVVSASQQNDALNVIQNVCNEKSAPLMLEGHDVLIQNIKRDIDNRNSNNSNNHAYGSTCDIVVKDTTYTDIHIPVPGDHQTVNCACAIAATSIVSASLPKLKDVFNANTVRTAIKKVNCPGRIEVVHWQDKLIILDRAHTIESIRALKTTIKEYINPYKTTFIIGMSDDKEVNTILDELMTVADSVVFTTTGNPRAANPDTLAEYWSKTDKRAKETNNCFSTSDISESLDIASKTASNRNMICVTGSTYLAGAIKSLLREK